MLRHVSTAVSQVPVRPNVTMRLMAMVMPLRSLSQSTTMHVPNTISLSRMMATTAESLRMLPMKMLSTTWELTVLMKDPRLYWDFFTDDACTNFADDYGGRKTYSSLSGGESMPYSQTSMIDTGCYSCAQEEDANGRKLDEVAVNEACETMYEPAGKCESKLAYGTTDYANEAGCDYMEGIKITRSNGIVISGANSANAVANTFIGLFSVSFVLLGSYVYYLKTKLDRGRINLSD